MNELKVSYEKLMKTRKAIIEDIMTINGIVTQLNGITTKIRNLKKALSPKMRKELIEKLDDVKEFLSYYVEDITKTLHLNL